MKIVAVLVLIHIALCQDHFELIYDEEFDTKILDPGKWIIENEEQVCTGNYINQLNCNRNSSQNLILTEDVLAIKAIKLQHKQNDKEYTSAKIITRHNFTYGRFEIRAALPAGKMLRPAMYLRPTTPGAWPETGQIDIMTNDQTNDIGNGVHYNKDEKVTYLGKSYRARKDLRLFNTYAIEWTKSEIRWFFNEHKYFNFSLGQTQAPNGHPFDKPFQLLIHLGVGGSFGFSGQTLNWYDYYLWNCSALILDYVRVYRWIEGSTGPIDEKLGYLKETSKTAPVICNTVMDYRYFSSNDLVEFRKLIQTYSKSPVKMTSTANQTNPTSIENHLTCSFYSLWALFVSSLYFVFN